MPLKDEQETRGQEGITTGRCCCHPRRRSVVADIVRAERVRQSSSGRLVIARVVMASGGRVQDGLLNDNGDEAIVVVPRHVSSVTVTLFVTHHPRHHRPCRPRPLPHHRRRRSPANLVTVAIAPAPCHPLRCCPHHRPCAFVVRHHPPSCSCPPPTFDSPDAS